ncbi:MAG: hypothetical protein ABJF88_14245 [Rhodothermales bacterium]|jgi:plasmid stability protein
MASLTLKGIPDDVMTRLRERAEAERRSLNQQAIRLLETALDEARPSFTDAYESFLKKHGPSPLDDASFDEVFEGLRDQSPGRPSPFEDEAGA